MDDLEGNDYEHDNDHDNDAQEAEDQMEDDDVEEHRSEQDSALVENDDGQNGYEGETENEDVETEEPIEEITEEDELPDEDTRTTGQVRFNLRSNRDRKQPDRLAHAMDNPANSKSYDTQFLQHGVSYEPTLRAAVQEMKRTGSNTNVFKCITGIVMMQLTAKAGIKKHGQVALDALFKEFSQLHDLGVFLAQDANKLTREEKKGSLRAISMITEKRCGRIKGRTVADGRPQRALYAKEDTTSPTVSTDALMLSILIDAKERRDVATADVAGA
jgi:hypothetical protein